MTSTRLNGTILKCAICGILKPKYRCSKCKITKYCNQNCQIKHWKSGHKQQCKKLTKLYNSNNMNGVSSSKQQQEMIKKQISQYVKGCHSNDPQTQFKYTQKIRKLLSIERDPPIQAVIDSDIVPRFVQFLQFDDFHQLQFEAAWCLTNIASGTTENTTAIIKYGAVPILVKLIQSKYDEVKEQAIWALSNVTGDGPTYRDLVLSHDVLSKMVPVWNTDPVNQQKLSLLRNATWTLSNFCRGKPSPDFKYIEAEIEALTIMIKHNDTEILQDSCWAFSYLSDVDINDTKQQQMEAIINSGSLNRLIELLAHESAHVRHPALRTIGNICTGSDQHTQIVINLGILQKLQYVIQNDRAPIKREACWTISNITAGSRQQIESVITANIFPILIDILRTEKYEIAKEALWAISNATSGGSDEQILYLVNKGVIEPLCKFLKQDTEPKIITVALEGIENILVVGKRSDDYIHNGYNKFVKYVNECGGIHYLKKLQSDRTIGDEIYDKVSSMINEYFNNKESRINKIFGDNKCNQCGASKSESIHLKMCKKCKAVFYCSKHCQKISWKRKHRFYCLS